VRLAVREFGPPPRLVSYSDRRLGCGFGVSAASITHRSLVLWRSSGGGQTLPATNCVLARAAPVAGAKALGLTIHDSFSMLAGEVIE
jgi:hypothetical protein